MFCTAGAAGAATVPGGYAARKAHYDTGRASRFAPVFICLHKDALAYRMPSPLGENKWPSYVTQALRYENKSLSYDSQALSYENKSLSYDSQALSYENKSLSYENKVALY